MPCRLYPAMAYIWHCIKLNLLISLGYCFIFPLHSLKNLLDKDIRVIYPITR